jgi:hypothetical protein
LLSTDGSIAGLSLLVKAYFAVLKFSHKESGEEALVERVYWGRVKRGEKRPEGRETFGI